MSKRDELIEKYNAHLREKCDIEPDADLMLLVCKAVGPAMYQKDPSIVAASDKRELDRIRENFLIKKLGLPEGPELDEGIQAVIDQYGRKVPNKHRVVVYYLLVKHFEAEDKLT